MNWRNAAARIPLFIFLRKGSYGFSFGDLVRQCARPDGNIGIQICLFGILFIVNLLKSVQAFMASILQKYLTHPRYILNLIREEHYGLQE